MKPYDDSPGPASDDRDSDLAAVLGPRTPAEEIIGDIWASALGTDSLGICEDFFDFRPPQQAADDVLAQIERIFNVKVSLNVFLRYPTIREFTDLLSDIWGGREIVDEIAWARIQVMDMKDSVINELLTAEECANDPYDCG